MTLITRCVNDEVSPESPLSKAEQERDAPGPVTKVNKNIRYEKRKSNTKINESKRQIIDSEFKISFVTGVLERSEIDVTNCCSNSQLI